MGALHLLWPAFFVPLQPFSVLTEQIYQNCCHFFSETRNHLRLSCQPHHRRCLFLPEPSYFSTALELSYLQHRLLFEHLRRDRFYELADLPLRRHLVLFAASSSTSAVLRRRDLHLLRDPSPD